MYIHVIPTKIKTWSQKTFILYILKVGFLDIDESAAKQSVEEFTSELGSVSCIFFKCDITESDRLKGEFSGSPIWTTGQ